MKRFWARFYAEDENGLLDKWPENMQCWVSGYKMNQTPVLCAIVDAESEEKALGIINSCYSRLQMSFIEEKEPSWLPGDRFPGAK